jgi:hypothetical protein
VRVVKDSKNLESETFVFGIVYTKLTLEKANPTKETDMYKEEAIVRQRRADLEGFAARQRLLREARSETPSGFRHRLAVVLLGLSKRLEPELAQPREANC